MPDRDFLPSSVPRGWRRAGRLWKHDGLSDGLIGLARQALTATLREDVVRGVLDVTRLDDAVEDVLRANLLGPLRPFRLRGRSIPEVDAEERAVIAALSPEAEWYGRQLHRGRRLTARPTRRRTTEAALREAVAIVLPSEP